MNIDQRLERFLFQTPCIHASAFVHPRAYLEGAVTMGPDSSVWPHAVVRADINTISIGTGTNIQDGSVLHLADDFGVEIGSHCTIGHLAMVHACRIGNCCLVGMHATILDGSVIGDESLIGANSLLTQGTHIPAGSLVLGSPAKVVRPLTADERKGLKTWADKYIRVAAAHRRKLAGRN